MRAISSAASISIHIAVAAAFLVGTTKPARPESLHRTIEWPVLVEPVERPDEGGSGSGLPMPEAPVVPPLDVLSNAAGLLPQSEALVRPPIPSEWVAGNRAGSGAPSGWSPFAGTGPEVLAGPLPVYPDLLRRAGIEGEVVLEARVDTAGRVQSGSVVVVSATHPGFVEPARQALRATLFRPAQVNGRPIAMLVRVPFAFSIRGGTGRAR
jgi:TonB family protein